MSYYGRLRFVLYRFLPIVIFAIMKYNLCGRRAVLERDVQAQRRQELDSDVLKFPLLDWHLMKVPKLLLAGCGREETKRPQAMDFAVAHKLRKYQITVN